MIELVEAYKAGESLRSIASRTGIDRRKISKAVKEAGLTVALVPPPIRRKTRVDPPRRKRPKIDAAALVEAYKSGESIRSISSRTQICRNTISNKIKQAGLKVLTSALPLDHDRIRVLWLSGLRVQEIAERLDYPVEAVRRSVKKRLVVVESGPFLPKSEAEEKAYLAQLQRLDEIKRKKKREVYWGDFEDVA